MKINTAKIQKLRPCRDRFENWLLYYKNFNGSVKQFLELDKITAQDKIWVAVRVLPRFLVEVFTIDCALSAYAADAAYDAYAAAYTAAADAADYASYAASYTASYAASYTAYDAAYAVERENQVDALLMIIKGERK
jgi:hypothetical protein